MKLETHKDKRGAVKDIMVGKNFSVAYITFKKDAVRGNHYHKKTTQMDYIVSGRVKCYRNDSSSAFLMKSGESAFHKANETHAYKALADAEMISICVGKRIGKNYSKDTYKLAVPLV
jgi:quercetin dioxygenase-like cupin family protein